MKNNTTVEKWEEVEGAIRFAKADMAVQMVKDFIHHSVQEAKAEMIYKALDEIGNVNAANALSKGEAKWEFKNGLDCVKAILNHLLASLKQEEEGV